MALVKYDITTERTDERYIIQFKFIVPGVQIRHVLSFRINNVIYKSGSRRADASIPNSHHTQAFKHEHINKEALVRFDFDINELHNISTLTFGLCNENVSWYKDSFVSINIELPKPNEPARSSSIAKRICILSSWNMKCGISQYTKNLYQALLANDYEVLVAEHTTAPKDLYDIVVKGGFDTLIVQFEQSLIRNTNMLYDCLSRLKSAGRGIKVFFIVHSENATLADARSRVDGFIFHKTPKMQGLNEKVRMIPMGVPVFEPAGDRTFYREKYRIDQSKFVMSTLGFMFKWKNHANVLTRMTPFLKQHKDVIVQMMTSYHSINNNECIQEAQKIKSIIQTHKLENQVIHITDFIPQSELNERLYLSDVGYLYAGIETTSSSASLKEFIASRLPVVKTNSSHHHDLNVGCVTTDKNVEQFVGRLLSLYNERDKLTQLRQEMEQYYIKTNYNAIIAKFGEILNG